MTRSLLRRNDPCTAVWSSHGAAPAAAELVKSSCGVFCVVRPGDLVGARACWVTSATASQTPEAGVRRKKRWWFHPFFLVSLWGPRLSARPPPGRRSRDGVKVSESVDCRAGRPWRGPCEVLGVSPTRRECPRVSDTDRPTLCPLVERRPQCSGKGVPRVGRPAAGSRPPFRR